MILEAFDFESIAESAVADVLGTYGLTVYTTETVLPFQLDRPRVEIKFTLGNGHLKWADQKTLQAIGLGGQKIETAWSSTLQTNIVTATDLNGKIDQATYRATVRTAYMNLGPQINGTILTLHKLQLVKESGTSRGIHPQESGTETLLMTHDLELSLNLAAFTGYEMVAITPSGPAVMYSN